MEKFKKEYQLIFDELKKDGFTFGNEQHKQIPFTKNGITFKINADLVNGKDIYYFEPRSYYDFVKDVILKTYKHEKEKKAWEKRN